MEQQFENIYMKRFLYFNVYVIKGKNGDILIDTGFIGIRKKLIKWLKQFNIKLIILTHAHVDHVWNTSYLKKIYKCQIAMSEKDIENIDNEKIKSKPSKKKYKLWTKIMNYGMKSFKTPKFDVDIPLKDNQTIKRYGLNLKIISLPGHTNGSIGILYNNYLFAGDALVYRQKYPEIAYQNQNNKEALLTYEKILKLSPKIIFIGHDRKITIDKLQKNISEKAQ